MTPFGLKMRQLRHQHSMTLKQMAHLLSVSPAYLSALEHGKRGTPRKGLIHQICGLFHLIWDDAEEIFMLASLSHPRITVNTAGLTAEATELANRLAQSIDTMPNKTIVDLLHHVKAAQKQHTVKE